MSDSPEKGPAGHTGSGSRAQACTGVQPDAPPCDFSHLKCLVCSGSCATGKSTSWEQLMGQQCHRDTCHTGQGSDTMGRCVTKKSDTMSHVGDPGRGYLRAPAWDGTVLATRHSHNLGQLSCQLGKCLTSRDQVTQGASHTGAPQQCWSESSPLHLPLGKQKKVLGKGQGLTKSRRSPCTRRHRDGETLAGRGDLR